MLASRPKWSVGAGTDVDAASAALRRQASELFRCARCVPGRDGHDRQIDAGRNVVPWQRWATPLWAAFRALAPAPMPFLSAESVGCRTTFGRSRDTLAITFRSLQEKALSSIVGVAELWRAPEKGSFLLALAVRFEAKCLTSARKRSLIVEIPQHSGGGGE